MIEKPNKIRFTLRDRVIYDGEKRIGSYDRDEKSFFPFKLSNEKWYALYSEERDRTFVMSLPDCKKIAECDTAKPTFIDPSGFYPFEYWVPFIVEKREQWWHNPEGISTSELSYDYSDFKWHHLNFGFMSGCYWGLPEQIRMIDLTQIESGIIKVAESFCDIVPQKINSFSDIIEVYPSTVRNKEEIPWYFYVDMPNQRRIFKCDESGVSFEED